MTIMSKKRWYLKVIFHALDICKVSGWLFYCRHCDQLAVPKKRSKIIACIHYRACWGTRLAGKSNLKLVGRPKNRSLSPSVVRKAGVAKTFPDVRYDLRDHFP